MTDYQNYFLSRLEGEVPVRDTKCHVSHTCPSAGGHGSPPLLFYCISHFIPEHGQQITSEPKKKYALSFCFTAQFVFHDLNAA
jgi:hypothetical protein